MNGQDWSEFWWTNITGAHLVVTKVVDALADHTAVIVDIPPDLPWRQQMRSVIEDEFRRKTGDSDRIIEIIDAADEVSEDTEPGRFLLDRFAPNKEVRNGYRERSQKSIQDYIRENDVLKSRVIWVKGLSRAQAAKWITFCRDYGRSAVDSGSFVLEVQGSTQKLDSGRMCSVRLLDCISSDDVQLFNSFIAAEKAGYSMEWRRYLSTAAASICDTDAEVSAHLLEQIDIKKQSPLTMLGELAGEDAYAARGAASDSEHVFAYWRRQDLQELEQRLWKAQVKTLFPLIEMERIRIITFYEYELRSILEERYIEQFSERITNPVALELGTLCYVMRKFDCIRDQDLRDRIFFLHKCRNHLAHAHCCNVSEVRGLLDDAPGILL